MGWYWSTKGEGATFSGPHDTREQAIEEARSEGATTIYVGESRTVEVEVDADQVIDQWLNGSSVDLLYEDALDFWCRRVPQADIDALSAELTEVFKKHLGKWGEDTSWQVISNPAKAE